MPAELEHLTENHRNTLRHLAEHPTSHNLEWHDVLSLLGQIGKVTEEHNGKIRFRLGSEVFIFTRPRHKDIDEEISVRLRHLLRDAGYLEQ
nr:hypothetical protein [uncultured Microbacterium sp.]